MQTPDTPIAQFGPMINYVTYQPDGTLDGGYLQELQPEHANRYILCNDEVRQSWPLYRANAARDGVELIPYSPPPPMDEGSMWQVMRRETDRVAQTFGYVDMTEAVSFADDATVPQFQGHGQQLKTWRAQMWQSCHNIILASRNGDRENPNTPESLIAELPAPPVQINPF